jgi:hypothetical protein
LEHPPALLCPFDSTCPTWRTVKHRVLRFGNQSALRSGIRKALEEMVRQIGENPSQRRKSNELELCVRPHRAWLPKCCEEAPINIGARSEELMERSSANHSSSIIWKRADDLYPSLTCFCTYAPPRFTMTLRHTSGSEKSVSFYQLADSDPRLQLAR